MTIHEATITINRPSASEVAKRLMQMVRNEWGPTLTRGKLMGSLVDPWRNLEEEAHYPSLDEVIDVQFYQQLYDRDAIAARVVEVWPRECWQVQPKVYEDESPEVETPFEAAWKELGYGLQGDSYRREEEGSCVLEYLKRVDELSGIGRFGILLLGLDDGEDLSKPVKGVTEKNSVRRDKDYKPPTNPSNNAVSGRYKLTTNQRRIKDRKLIYLKAFSESQVTVQQWEGNFTSPRYGQPVMYSVVFGDYRSNLSAPADTRDVHWTRVIHVADTHHTTCSSDVIAVPRMYPVLNNLLGLRKIYLSDPEGYWRSAYPILALNTAPGEGDVDVNPQQVKDDLELVFQGMDRSAIFRALQPSFLAPGVSDPTNHIMIQIQGISIKLTIPQRVLMGSEQGVLAADQDSASWYTRRVPERNRNYTTPRIMGPFVDRCILVGVLPIPSQYHIWWPDITVQSAAEKAQILAAHTGAYAQAASSGIFTSIISEKDWLTKERGFTDEEAASIMASVDAALEEQKTEQMLEQEDQTAQQEEMVKRGLAPDPMDPSQIPGKRPNPFERGKQLPGKGNGK